MKSKGETERPTVKERGVARYSKAQFLGSRQWAGRDKDILSVVLDDQVTYTIEEAREAMQVFLTKEVD